MASMEGPLSKWTNVMKGWQFRWFVLDDNAGLLSYYTSKEKMMRGVRRGCVRLKEAVIGIDDDDDSTFTITVDGKIFHFQAHDPDERDRWIHSLEDTILRHAQFHQKIWKPHQTVPTIQDFDKKLTETDAYLQILIEQVKNLETRLEKCENEDERIRCLDIRDKANEMLDSIKHTIVFLQIAKNTAHPINGLYPIKSSFSPCQAKPIDVPRRQSFASHSIRDSSPLDAEVETGIEPALECCEESNTSLSKNADEVWPTYHPSTQRVMAGSDIAKSDSQIDSIDSTFNSSSVILPIPETSYSSSEDEDYFDAQNENDDSSSKICSQIASGQIRSVRTSFEDSTDSLDRQLDRRSSLQIMANKIDYDAIYEDDDEEDLGSVESHGSVISHLLSQVKLGMDLTKVVLPTFILERRSLLEMYADFFAHPDLFVNITNYTDPRERMIQVMRWYLSAFHAGRKSSIAKKPYNPIIGEIFRCHWDIPGASKSSDIERVSDGPVPWVTKEQLAFIAEQVSHHPPISAFYAEHYNKRISFSAHIWTKSKFLGLSIGVHMIGQGCVSLYDLDEEYIITFPNGYGRSILTVPWVELGGTTNITCAKTGYNANVDFHTKPFYGGKKHRITAEVFQPNDKKPFLTIAGEWNGCMQAKWSDGRSEVFVDTTQIRIIKKIVPPVANQEAMESRRLWKDVTAGLKMKNITRATEAKFQIEQRQRFEAKERKDKGQTWETRCFHEVGENWIYDNPLTKRLTETANKK